MILRPEPLTQTAFQLFGQVLDVRRRKGEMINHGHTLNFADLAPIDTGEGGRARVSIYRSVPVQLPFRLRGMERHPLGSQCFYPLHDRPFPVIVAPPGGRFGVRDLRAFITDGRQGINLRAGVWHHYQLTLDEESDYLVIDRAGPGVNTEERPLDGEVLLQF